MADNLIIEYEMEGGAGGIGGPSSPSYASFLSRKSRRVDANLHVDGQVSHTAPLSDHMGTLLASSMYSDLTLVVDKREFQVHRIVMATRSEYFR